MRLTKEEFSLFNNKSKLELLIKDGVLLKQRYAKDYVLVSLFSIYQFQIEAVLDIGDMRTLSIMPVFNPDTLKLYPP